MHRHSQRCWTSTRLRKCVHLQAPLSRFASFTIASFALAQDSEQISRAEAGGRLIEEQQRLEGLSTVLSAQQTSLEILTNLCSKDVDLGLCAFIRADCVQFSIEFVVAYQMPAGWMLGTMMTMLMLMLMMSRRAIRALCPDQVFEYIVLQHFRGRITSLFL